MPDFRVRVQCGHSAVVLELLEMADNSVCVGAEGSNG